MQKSIVLVASIAVLNPPQKMMPAAKAPAAPSVGTPYQTQRRQMRPVFGVSSVM